MKIAVIHGQAHHGITYTMTKYFLAELLQQGDELLEFFMPIDGPDFCHGCNVCFLKGESFCPSAKKVQPIACAMENADIILLDSPNYVMEMSAAMKNLLEHLGYRWFSHRPHSTMFCKQGIVISSAAGVKPTGVVKSLARQLYWMGVPVVHSFAIAIHAMDVTHLKESQLIKIRRAAAKIAKKVRKKISHPAFSIRQRFFFYLFRSMQKSDTASWNPLDRSWWEEKGWLGKVRPW